jgi:hypothetical protein
MKLKIVFLAIIIGFLTSCATQRRCAMKFPMQSSRDSIYIESIKEIPVPLPGDTIRVDVPINCPDQDVIKVENSKLKQEISIIKGKLISNTTIKPDTVFVHSKEIKTVIKEVKVPEPVKYVPKFYKYCALILICLVIITIIYFALKYKLKILTVFKK